MTDLLLVLLINFFALYTTSLYLAVLKKEEQFGKYVSFFTVGGDVSGLTLKGFKYPLDGYDLTVADSGLTVSNEIAAETAEVTYDRGSLLMIMSRD